MVVTMALVLCRRIPVITKLQHTALTLITILPLVTAHPLHTEIIQRTGPAQVTMEKVTITQVRMLHCMCRILSKVLVGMGFVTFSLVMVGGGGGGGGGGGEGKKEFAG